LEYAVITVQCGECQHRRRLVFFYFFHGILILPPTSKNILHTISCYHVMCPFLISSTHATFPAPLTLI